MLQTATVPLNGIKMQDKLNLLISEGNSSH